MEKDACIEDQKNGNKLVHTLKASVLTTAYRYTKEELLEIKELPVSNERPECLSQKYDSDGVWDPEKWHASLYPSECDLVDDRPSLKRRIADPRERLKEDDLEVVLSPQRRSFGGGCQVPAALTRRPISPLENKENESLRLGGTRRIGSGRIMATRGFERDVRVDKERNRERESDFKDKRFRRDFGDKRVFGERRRNDSYAEEEPEWFSAGPTSQSETIELIGFDDKALEDDKRKHKRSRRRTDSAREVECNGGISEEPQIPRETGADQEVPHPDVLPEQTAGDFDFNEFFNLEKTMPGLASMIEEVLGEGSVTASRFSRWFSSNRSPSGSRSSSLRSTPHEELERLAGPQSSSPCHGSMPYFTPIPSEDRKEKVDILELLHKAKIDFKPLLSSMNANKARLKESTNSGVALSLEEVECGLIGLKVQCEQSQPPPRQLQGQSGGTPFMAEHLEDALTGKSGGTTRPRDPDMSAFNKLVSSMKASGTLPTQPKTNTSSQSADPDILSPLSEAQVPATQQKNVFQELLGVQGAPHAGSPRLSGLLGCPDAAHAPGLMPHRGSSPLLFPQRAQMQDFYTGCIQPTTGFPVAPGQILRDQIPELHRAISPGPTTQQLRALSMGAEQPDLDALMFQQDLAIHARQQYQQAYSKHAHDKAFRNRQARINRSPGPHLPSRSSPVNSVTSMLSPSFTPTSVIKKMYESKEKTKEESISRPGDKEDTANSQEDASSPSSFLDGVDSGGPEAGGVKVCSTPVSAQNRHSKEAGRARPSSSTGHHTPAMLSPASSSYPRPIYPMPLLPHVPLVRPPPPQLHPSVVQRMITQSIQPPQLGPALLQTGIFPQTVDLSQLQGLPPALIGQPLYQLSTTGHPLVSPRAAGTHMQLAVMQQQLQQQQRQSLHTLPTGSLQLENHGTQRTNLTQRRAGSPPLGLAKWFGSDVLQQPLPSMPSAKVISVDELEFRQ